MDLSNKIRRFRFENDEMTQKQLAERVGVSRQTMNAFENCNHAPRIDVAIRIADVFGVSVDELFSFEYAGKPDRRPNVNVAAPTHRTERAPQSRIGKTESIQPVEPFGQSSTKDEPQDQKALLASLRNVMG